MDQKTLDSISTQLSLVQLQIDALVLMIQEQHPTEPVREQFGQLVDERVKDGGLQTMQGFRERIREGIVHQDLKEIGLEHLWNSKTEGDVTSSNPEESFEATYEVPLEYFECISSSGTMVIDPDAHAASFNLTAEDLEQMVDDDDQPGVFVPPTMLAISSQAGWFRVRVAGPRGYCVA